MCYGCSDCIRVCKFGVVARVYWVVSRFLIFWSYSKLFIQQVPFSTIPQKCNNNELPAHYVV